MCEAETLSLDQIRALSPNKVTAFERVVPLITPELFLLATVRTDDLELGRRMAEAGLRLNELEDFATTPLESPEKLRF
ncbi:MAG TPA: hypothetical protein VE734_04170 [Terriglobales bacterium]|nr:hypothetical protein [Terriglobales bacterium]